MVGEPGEPKEKSRTDMFLEVMNDALSDTLERSPIAFERDWFNVRASLDGQNFSRIEELRSVLAKELENRKWNYDLAPEVIMDVADRVIKLIDAWQEKK